MDYLKKRFKLEMQYWHHSHSIDNLIKNNSIPPLTDNDIKIIDSYWKKWGVKFNNYNFHRLFYFITGKKDPRFLPFPFAAFVLYPYYNDSSKIPAYADKNMFYQLMPGMRFPKLLGQRINNRFFDSHGRWYGEKVNAEYSKSLFQEISQNGN